MTVHDQRSIERTAVDVVRAVPDPEMPYLTLGDLGVVGRVMADAPDLVHVQLTPTYLGCPATEVIARDVEAALREAGWPAVTVEYRFDPPWTPDRITEEGRRKLAAEGIAPPSRSRPGAPVFVTLSLTFPAGGATAGGATPGDATVECPHCGARETRLLSPFGSTPCQELRRCSACAEPFPAIKAAR